MHCRGAWFAGRACRRVAVVLRQPRQGECCPTAPTWSGPDSVRSSYFPLTQSGEIGILEMGYGKLEAEKMSITHNGGIKAS